MRDLYVMGGDRTGGTLPTDKDGTEENQLGILLPSKVAACGRAGCALNDSGVGSHSQRL